MADVTLEGLMDEGRRFPPSPEFVSGALVTDSSLHDRAAADPEAFWASQARSLLDWETDFSTTCEWELPFAKWFVGGRLNVSYNCVDRHVIAGHGDQVAYLWEGEPGDRREITYAALLDEVARTRERARSPSGSRRAIGSRSTWAWFPSSRWPCSRARESARPTRSCSADSPPIPFATASSTRRPRYSSPATAPGGGAGSCR